MSFPVGKQNKLGPTEDSTYSYSRPELKNLTHVKDLDSAEIPLQMESPTPQGPREGGSTDSDEFYDCEEDDLIQDPNIASCSYSSSVELESSELIYHSFNSNEAWQLEDTNFLKTYRTAQPRSIEFSKVETPIVIEDEKSSSENAETTSEMLVTLTSTQMQISAKRDTSPAPVPGAKILESSIFDKVNLKSDALDTEEFNRSLARTGYSPPDDALPSLSVQEKRLEDISNEMRTPSTHHQFTDTMHLQLHLPAYSMEPAPQGTICRFSNGLCRAQSAPTEIKSVLVSQEVIEADQEISAILGGHSGDDTLFSPIEGRSSTSLSEPFQATISTVHSCAKKRSTTWIKERLCFVSYDTESDAASISRSDATGETGRKEFSSTGLTRSRTSSTLRYATGAVKGPRVSPVPRGGIKDFSKTDVYELNRKMRTEPQLVNIDMQEWTSKYIGFQSAADYYAHMVCDLSLYNINVLTLLKSQLGDTHPLIGEIIEKLVNGTSDLPNFIMEDDTLRCHKTKENHQRNRIRKARDSWCNRVETTLTKCGLSTTFFDRSSTAFKSEQEYFEYIAQRIINEDFTVPLDVLALIRKQLGDDHPFINILETSESMKTDFENQTDPMLDSVENIQPPMKLTPDQEGLRIDKALSTPVYVASKEPQDNTTDSNETHRCSCFGGLRRIMSRKSSKGLSYTNSTSNKAI
eukprot:g6313.t1